MQNSGDLLAPKQGRFTPTAAALARARSVAFRGWNARRAERGLPPARDLSSACKFCSLFVRELFGGQLRGNEMHQFVLRDGEIIDLAADSADVVRLSDPYRHDPEFWGNPDHRESLASCVPRVADWVACFEAELAAEAARGLAPHGQKGNGENMTETTETPRIAAWKMILEQVEALQVKMQEHGIQAVVDHYSTDDGIAGLQGAEFINGCASRIHMSEHDFGEAPAMVSIRSNGDAEELAVHPFDGIVSMQDAATQIFENICEYVYATSEPDAVIDGFDLRIETTGGIEVHVLGATAERWNVPPVTTTYRQLEGWFEREIERLGEALTDRFLAVARQRAEEITRDYPGLELDIMAGHGTLLFRHTLNGRRVNYDDIPVEEIEKAYLGLSERLDEMEDVYARLQGTVAVGDFERIAMRPEPDASPEPDAAALRCETKSSAEIRKGSGFRTTRNKKLERYMSKPEDDRFLEAKIVVTVMGQGSDAATFASELSRMSLSEISSEMNNGDFIGSVGAPIVEEVAPEQVAHRLKDLGNDGHFFDLHDETVPQGTAREDAAGRILRAQMAQGWSSETLEALGRRFIEKAGLSNAFADFLEAQAAEENEMSADPDGGM